MKIFNVNHYIKNCESFFEIIVFELSLIILLPYEIGMECIFWYVLLQINKTFHNVQIETKILIITDTLFLHI